MSEDSGAVRICTVDDCGRPYRARGYCNTHYAAARYHGMPAVRNHPKQDPLARLLAKVDQSAGPDACWPWTGMRDPKGYGRGYAIDGSRGRTMAAHRAIYAAVHGEISEGLYILHSCDNPPCCNPAHLRAGTPQENMDDRHRSGLKKANGCWLPRAVPISDETLTAIRIAYRPRVKGHTIRAVAADFGLDQATIFNIVNRRGRWADSA